MGNPPAPGGLLWCERGRRPRGDTHCPSARLAKAGTQSAKNKTAGFNCCVRMSRFYTRKAVGRRGEPRAESARTLTKVSVFRHNQRHQPINLSLPVKPACIQDFSTCDAACFARISAFFRAPRAANRGADYGFRLFGGSGFRPVLERMPPRIRSLTGRPQSVVYLDGEFAKVW